MSVTVEQVHAAASALGMHPAGIMNRLNQGWDEKLALTTPRYSKRNGRTTRRVTDRTSRTVTTTTRGDSPEQVTVEPGARVVIDIARGVITIEHPAAPTA